jgi:hypothetical protein
MTGSSNYTGMCAADIKVTVPYPGAMANRR